jgi:hypothetical protein
MVLGGFPGVVRSLHQATGVAIWLAAFTLAYVAKRASGERRAASVEDERFTLAAGRSTLPGFAR